MSEVPPDDPILVLSSADPKIGLVTTDRGDDVACADSRRGTLDTGKTDVFFAVEAAPTGGSQLSR